MGGARYTLDQIKGAFWEVFHESGELWFDYLDGDQENQESTEHYWDEFLAELALQKARVTKEED